jgi:hypothetical protein
MQLVEETNISYHNFLETVDEGCSSVPDMTVLEMCLFLPVIMQMGHDQRGRLKDCLPTLEQFFIAFCGNTMK